MSHFGMLSWFTKKPANSMNGIIKTGVNVTANYLSAKRVDIIRAYEPAALYNKIKINTIKI